MQNTNKKIGIWGYGLTGKSAVNYYHEQGYQLAVVDKKELSTQEIDNLKNKNISFSTENEIEDFLKGHEYILPSPGIDLRPYPQYHAKWLSELDEFYKEWQKPMVSITGSIGKTTVTHLLSKLLEHSGKKIAMGGNIGIPVFDLLSQKKSADMAVIEISSFQLELTKTFAPDLAIWTNLHPNHLDRHGSEEEYFNAKAHMLTFQTSSQQALVPFEFKDKIKTEAHMNYFTRAKPTTDQLRSLAINSSLYYIDNNHIIRYSNHTHLPIIACSALPPITFEENWLILIAALHILGIQMPDFSSLRLNLPEHRMEKVATINGIDFINDSKATTAQSTLAAVDRLQHRPVLLLLGGKGKGVDRKPLVEALKEKVKKIYCFGGEAQELNTFCIQHGISSSAFANLDEAFETIIQEMKSGDQVLLSPAGTSYDLYKIFSERGDHFKRLVHTINRSEK